MTISVRLTFDGFEHEQDTVDGGAEGSHSFHVRAEMGDDVLLDLHFSVGLGRLKGSRQSDGDKAIEPARGGSGIEENYGRSADIAGGKNGWNRLKLVDHVMHPVQGVMCVRMMPRRQGLSNSQVMPSLQGPFRSVVSTAQGMAR